MSEVFSKLQSWLGKTKMWLSPTWIEQSSIHRALMQERHWASGRMLDVGCRDMPYRWMFPACEMIGVDVTPPSVNGFGGPFVLADAQHLPFLEGKADAVLATQMLYNLESPSQGMAEFYRVLRTGGILILTTPQTWGDLRGEPNYWRFTESGLRLLAQQAGFEVLRLSQRRGLWAMVGQRMSGRLFSRCGKPAPWPFKVAVVVLSAILQRLFVAIDKLDPVQGESLGHVMVARRNSEPAISGVVAIDIDRKQDH